MVTALRVAQKRCICLLIFALLTFITWQKWFLCLCVGESMQKSLAPVTPPPTMQITILPQRFAARRATGTSRFIHKASKNPLSEVNLRLNGQINTKRYIYIYMISIGLWIPCKGKFRLSTLGLSGGVFTAEYLKESFWLSPSSVQFYVLDGLKCWYGWDFSECLVWGALEE